MKYPKNILLLIEFLKKLPGVGTKTAERFAFNLLNWADSDLQAFSKILFNIKQKITKCPSCGCLKENTCFFCNNRNTSAICILASAKDVYALENTHSYNGLYHILDNLISPINGFNIDDANIEKLQHKINTFNIKEVIIALDSTLEGDATALFIKNKLKNFDIKISRIAFGLPIGSNFDYIDGGTLAKAFTGRQNF